jgi:peroxiredoxin
VGTTKGPSGCSDGPVPNPSSPTHKPTYPPTHLPTYFPLALQTLTPPPTGSPAPDFTLPSTSGKEVTLSALRGRIVLLAFFPLAFTSTCTQELCDMRDDWDQFGSADVVTLPISVDSVPTLVEFKGKHSMRADLLSDFKREVSRKYGVLLEDRFFSTRAYFLIDRAGVIRWEHIEANPSQKRSNDELLQQIRALA